MPVLRNKSLTFFLGGLKRSGAMKNHALIAIFFAFSTIVAFSQEKESVADKANELFSKFEKRDFVPLSNDGSVVAVSGWEMKTTNGKPLHRALLQRQADQIAELGVDAFPVSMRFLDHEEMYIRYIAAESLRRLTGKSPPWQNFGKPRQESKGNPDWSDRAKAAWQTWYERERKSNAESADDQSTITPGSVSIAKGENIVQQEDYSILVTCFHGPIDSEEFCSKKITGKRNEIEKSDMTCGYANKVSKISWTCVKDGALGDLYTFTRVFSAGCDCSKTYVKRFHYHGERVVVFEDDVHTIVIEQPKETR